MANVMAMKHAHHANKTAENANRAPPVAMASAMAMKHAHHANKTAENANRAPLVAMASAMAMKHAHHANKTVDNVHQRLYAAMADATIPKRMLRAKPIVHSNIHVPMAAQTKLLFCLLENTVRGKTNVRLRACTTPTIVKISIILESHILY